MSVVGTHGAKLRRSIDAAWAETVRFSPMQKGRADPERTAQDVIAILRTDEQGAVAFASGHGDQAKALGAKSPAGGAVLKVDPTAYPDLAVRSGDMVRAVDRVNRPVFEVDRVDPTSHHRLIVRLKSVGR
ncbi:MAG: hypothetical protein AAGI03_01600 [Pseudomonadota bacterium]